MAEGRGLGSSLAADGRLHPHEPLRELLECHGMAPPKQRDLREEEGGERDRQTDRQIDVEIAWVREWRVSSTAALLFSNLSSDVTHSPCHLLYVDCTDRPWYHMGGTI